MTDRRFPVANTDPPLTIPWEVAETSWNRCSDVPFDSEIQRHFLDIGGMTPLELDKWYGKHWREMAR